MSRTRTAPSLVGETDRQTVRRPEGAGKGAEGRGAAGSTVKCSEGCCGPRGPLTLYRVGAVVQVGSGGLLCFIHGPEEERRGMSRDGDPHS